MNRETEPRSIPAEVGGRGSVPKDGAGTPASERSGIILSQAINIGRPPQNPGPTSDRSWRWDVVPLSSLSAGDIAAWGRLAAQSFLAAPGWALPFNRAFAPEAETWVHLLRFEDRLVAALPLSLHGWIRHWSNPINEHVPYQPLALDPDVPGAAREVVDHLLSSAEVFELSVVQLHARATQLLLDAAASKGALMLLRPLALGDSALSLEGGFEAVLSRLPRGLQRDFRQGSRRLSESGRLTFERIDGGPDLFACFEECLNLEAAGWKGHQGDPIKADLRTDRFYRSVTDEASRAGALALYLLRLDGRLIAFEYCLRHGGRIDLLKISYDPAFAHRSPGTVLRGHILRAECERGDIHSYHLGRPSEWKLRWTKAVEPLVALRVYSDRFSARMVYLTDAALRHPALHAMPLRHVARWARRSARGVIGGGGF